MTQIKDFGFLGTDFQLKLISQIICDRTFGLNIVPMLDSKYFENQYCKQIVNIIKDYNEKHNNQLLTLSGVKERILAETKDAIQRQGCMEVLADVNKRSLQDDESTKELAFDFCKQQAFIKAMKEAEKIVKNGNIDGFKIEEIFRKAMSATDKNDDSIEITDDLDEALEEDYRKPLPTGIDGLDVEIGGGLAKGELGMLIIPTGVGKTTLLSKFANTAYNNGANVLQIFFEDKKKDIQRKHFSALTRFPLNDLHKYREVVKESVEVAKNNGGRLILKKCPSDSTTILHIKQYIRFLINKGIKIDMLILDYIDCVVPSKLNEDSNANEGTVIRQLESLTAEFDIATWTAAQGNRSSISADVVSTDQIQGSIKRAQVGHIIISVAKTLEQKEHGLATMAILKSRVGGDGKIFQNMVFQNDTMTFDTAESSLISQLSFDENKRETIDKMKQEKAIQALRNAQQIREKERENTKKLNKEEE